MVDTTLSMKEKIEYVNKSIEKIHRSSTLLSAFLQELERDENRETILKIKREIRTIIMELNKMGGFCDNKVQRTISILSEMGAQFTAMKGVRYFIQNQRWINYWSSQAISILLDYNKSPFSLKGGIELNLQALKGFIEGTFSRK